MPFLMDRVGFLGCLFSLNRHLHARRFLLAGDCALALGVVFPQQGIHDVYIRITGAVWGSRISLSTMLDTVPL